MGACWAHNPEVGRSKLLSAKSFFLASYSCSMILIESMLEHVLIIAALLKWVLASRYHAYTCHTDGVRTQDLLLKESS